MSDAAANSSREIPFLFGGRSQEYFSIWIVNLALTILTLGIFSAWAKVRRERYFYGNTSIDGAPFQYTAPPLVVLRGRLIAAALLVVYVVLGEFNPIAQVALIATLFVATPWIVVNGWRFRARYSAFNSLCFQFDGQLRNAWGPYFWLLLLVVPTLGLIFPYVRYRQRRFMVTGHRYGDIPFHFGAHIGDFAFIYIVASVVMLLGFGGATIIVMGVSVTSGAPATYADIYLLATMVLLYLAMFLGWTYISVSVTNLVFNTSRLGEHALLSRLRVKDIAWIYLSNTVAIIATVGLLIPWAQIRLARYRAERMTLLASGDLSAFSGRSSGGQSATGAEAADLFDVDLSL